MKPLWKSPFALTFAASDRCAEAMISDRVKMETSEEFENLLSLYSDELKKRSPLKHRVFTFMMRRGCGIISKSIFTALAILYFVFVFGIVIPFESLYKPRWLVTMGSVLAVYFYFNVMFYFFMAASTGPGNPKKKPHENNGCKKCRKSKPPGTHHCSMCRACIIKMDHHCVWLSQCIGAGNHRYFFQLLASLTISMFLLLTFGYNTFYNNYSSNAFSYCSAGFDHLFWSEFICRDEGELVAKLTTVLLFLSFILQLVMGGFCASNCFMISYGTTYLEYLMNFRTILKSHPSLDQAKTNWQIFLGLDEGRSFWNHILLPSFHVSERYIEEEPTMLDKEMLRVVVL
ncbi:hypothetical protein L596_028320 [Steinernema carpocapsae]|uniref:Palmitoyltransferase n=1 Tax=Steinernema carpocapsae TaxID=34508 RepID=A0A4U5LY76_STECR|nr:hypothetical protein L596_028320 [Steinernema carpocapsae]